MLQTYQKSKSKWNISETQHCKEPYNTQVCVDFTCSRQVKWKWYCRCRWGMFSQLYSKHKQYMVETEEIQRGWCVIAISWTQNSWKQCFFIKIHTYGTFLLSPNHFISTYKTRSANSFFHTEIVFIQLYVVLAFHILGSQ